MPRLEKRPDPERPGYVWYTLSLIDGSEVEMSIPEQLADEWMDSFATLTQSRLDARLEVSPVA